MIKLERKERPRELTDDVCRELTRLYSENKEKEVWNSPKIKQPVKDALYAMSHGKCAYCECELNIESKDITIDHFLPKVWYPGKVVEWENLFPACLRCNREKKDYAGRIINPCLEQPRQYLALRKRNPYRLKGRDMAGIGENTIRKIRLNDIDRVMVPRLREWENIKERLDEIREDLLEEGYKTKYRTRLQVLMDRCTAENSYAAMKSSNMLADDSYQEIRRILNREGWWTDRLQMTENEMAEIALQFI